MTLWIVQVSRNPKEEESVCFVVAVDQSFTMESLLKNLKEQVTCAICLDTFTDPKTITCLHTFCCDCLKKHALISRRNGKFRCPECQAEVDLPEAMKRQSFCSQQYHEREIVGFFCLKCKLCVCQICIATDHKSHEGHDVELLDKVADGEKVNILERAKMLKEKTKLYSDAIFKLEQTELELHTNITNVKHEVSQTAEQIIAKIRESEREIITYLENTRASRSELLNSAKTQVQSSLKQINQAVEFAEQLVQKKLQFGHNAKQTKTTAALQRT